VIEIESCQCLLHPKKIILEFICLWQPIFIHERRFENFIFPAFTKFSVTNKKMDFAEKKTEKNMDDYRPKWMVGIVRDRQLGAR
jgi:hypothetical protein